jgi:hypothetical protein
MEDTKLAINLREGTVQVEGSEDFVRFIYQDFKEHLSRNAVVQPAHLAIEHSAASRPLLADHSEKPKKNYTGAKKQARKNAASDSKVRTNDYRPHFNTKLDLAGLVDIFDQWAPANNHEKILLFAMFLRDKLNVAPCTADDIYTCFATLNRKGKTKVPEAFLQAFRDAQSRTNFIEFKSLQQILVTIPGDNHYNEKHKKGAKE